MVQAPHLRRLMFFTVLLGLGLCGLGGVLIHIQVILHPKYKEIAENHTLRVYLREPRRGDILDAQGHPLATTFPVKRIFADPSLMGAHYAAVAKAVAPLMGFDEADLAQRLRPTVVRTNASGGWVTNSYVNLRRKLTAEQWQQVTQAMAGLKFPAPAGRQARRQMRAREAFFRNLRLHSLYAVDDQRREYPSGRLASHVLGFTQEFDQEFNDTWVTEIKGIDGVDRWMDEKLRGIRGWMVTETDRRSREVVMHRGQAVEPRPGLNVVLTIDMVIQSILEAELAEMMKTYTPESAVAIVVRPRTGEVLGLAVLPDFDPGNPGGVADVRRNRAISDLVEPGSTFKIVVVAAALSEKIVTLEDNFFCENGHWTYCGTGLRDHGSYGWLTTLRVITKSSNIGAAKIGVKLGEDRLYRYVRDFGFGSPTGIPLPGEVGGIVHPVKDWDRLTITRIPMGHAIAVTPLQMVMAMAALANEGRLMKPMLIKGLQDADGRTIAQYEPMCVRQAVSPSAAQDMVTALKTVPTKEGTAVKAAMEFYTVAGKTGTAQVPTRGGYLEGIYVASFCGFFPADNPELCIYVMLNKVDRAKGGYYGGQVAAPHFKRIADQCAQYLKIRPDREEAVRDAIAAATSKESSPPAQGHAAP